jgi:hypothetical protein
MRRAPGGTGRGSPVVRAKVSGTDAGIIGSMDDLKPRLADAEAKLAHVKEYL